MMTEIYSYEHKGQVVGLTWSTDGSQLFSASFDGAIRSWRKDKIETFRETRVSAANENFDGTIWSLDWSAAQNGLITAEAAGIVLTTSDSDRRLVGKKISAVEVKCSPTNNYVALREMVLSEDGKQSQPRLRVRRLDSLSDAPTLDSNIFYDGWWTYDIAWAPNGGLLAVLAGGSLTIWMIGHTAPLRTLVLGRWANAVAWLSNDELAVAYGDGNVRIFDRQPSSGEAYLPKSKAVLEAHEAYVTSISLGMTGQQFATADTDGCICIWDRSRKLIARRNIEMVAVTGGLEISFNPYLPILAYAHGGRVGLLPIENESLAHPAAAVPIDAPRSYVDELLQTLGLLQPGLQTSDEVATLWGIETVQEQAIDALLLTKQLRRIASAVQNLDQLLRDALRQLWIAPTREETLALEDIEISAHSGDDRDTTQNKVFALLTRTANDVDERKRTIAISAFALFSFRGLIRDSGAPRRTNKAISDGRTA